MESIEKFNLATVTEAINTTHNWYAKQVAQQVNTALTLRNWTIGLYIFEYEQHGSDRAQYGQKLYSELAKRLKDKGVKSLSSRTLYWCTGLYRAYPQILKTVFSKLQSIEIQLLPIQPFMRQSFEDKLLMLDTTSDLQMTDPDLLVTRLCFSHFIELLKCDTSLKRLFYETESIVNNWNVRELQRAMDSHLFDRMGMSTDKQAIFVSKYLINLPKEEELKQIVRQEQERLEFKSKI